MDNRAVHEEAPSIGHYSKETRCKHRYITREKVKVRIVHSLMMRHIVVAGSRLSWIIEMENCERDIKCTTSSIYVLSFPSSYLPLSLPSSLLAVFRSLSPSTIVFHLTSEPKSTNVLASNNAIRNALKISCGQLCFPRCRTPWRAS